APRPGRPGRLHRRELHERGPPRLFVPGRHPRRRQLLLHALRGRRRPRRRPARLGAARHGPPRRQARRRAPGGATGGRQAGESRAPQVTALDDLPTWLVEEGRLLAPKTLLAQLAGRLSIGGVEPVRIAVLVRTLHPLVEA